MTPAPISQGLLICERVILDRDTGNPSCIGIFTHLGSTEFPVLSPLFHAFSTLTNAVGSGIIKLAVWELLEMTQVAEYTHPIEFSDRLSTVFFNIRISDLTYALPGAYSFVLTVDDDFVAQTNLVIVEHST